MKKELIDIIKDELNDFELDYRAGAWEDFHKQGKKKSPLTISLKRLAVAAGVVLGALFLFLIADKYLQKKQQDKIVLRVPFKNMPLIHAVSESSGMYVQYKRRQHAKPNPIARLDKMLADTLSARELKRMPPIIGDTINTNPGIQFLAILPDLLIHHPANTLAKHMPSYQNGEFRKRWQLGLSVGNGVSYGQEHQFGAGAFVTYQLSRRLAISSGFYFNQLGALKNVAHDRNFPDPGKLLTNVKVNLGGLEIPFELKYKVTRRFYTKFGASVYSIGSQQQQLFFTQTESSIVNYVDPTGTAFSEMARTGTSVVEAVPASQLEKNKLISIYNFSVGYEYPILHGQKLFIEPFIKLPNKEFSVYRVNLAQTGIRLNVSF